MTARHVATGLNPTPRWVWAYFRDTTLVVPRTIAVRVGWGLVADQYEHICDGVNKEYARRLEAQAAVEQLALPLEKWE